jgi:hypothetical protein
VKRARFTFIISRFRGLLLAPGREWKVISDERPGGVTPFRDFVVLPCGLLSLLVVLLRWTSADPTIAPRWGIINFVACTAGCYLTLRLARLLLAADSEEIAATLPKLVGYAFAIYIPFRSLAMGLPGDFIGELLSVCSLYSLYILYAGMGALTTLDTARRRGGAFLVGLLVISLPWIITRLLVILLDMPVIII